MTQCIALLRGINVGRAKRVAMADLRALFEQLGHERLRTVLNTGNVLFGAPRPHAGRLATAIGAAIVDRFGFSAHVIVLTARDFEAIVAENPLTPANANPSHLLVGFVDGPSALELARPLLAQVWAPEALALGRQAAYLKCPDGVIASRLLPAFTRATAEGCTSRNWATVLKIQAALADVGAG